MAAQFERVRNNRPSRTKFNLSYEKKMTCDFGYLYPVMCDEMVPGDVFKINCEAVIRSQPLLAPILHRIDVKVEYFFVPYRLLWPDWEEFITGGEDGYTPISNPGLEPVPPIWQPGNATSLQISDMKPGSLWDYLGMPTIPDSYAGTFPIEAISNRDIWPLDFPRRAYNMIWWEYYRDENLQRNPRGLPNDWTDKYIKEEFCGHRGNNTGSTGNIAPGGREDSLALIGRYGNRFLLRRSWEKDFFTSSLPFQQKGDTPALPLAGIIPIQPVSGGDPSGIPALSIPVGAMVNATGFQAAETGGQLLGLGVQRGIQGINNSDLGDEKPTVAMMYGADFNSYLTNNWRVNLDEAVTFDVSDLRLAFQTQRWLEQNARAGSRYTEFLRAHFGVSPNDSRLQRPEYVGGLRLPLIISEVLQTSETVDVQSPQGNMAGHGISVGREYVGSYHAEEFGVMIGLLSFVPKPAYQQGMNRQWLRKTPLDFYFPEFAHLSERAVEQQEIFWDPINQTPEQNLEIFGFQGIYDEMRVKQSSVHGLFRHDAAANFEFWHLSRWFSQPPLLNENFITIRTVEDNLKRAYPAPSEPPFFVSFGNDVLAIRPMPFMAEPGLIDHV